MTTAEGLFTKDQEDYVNSVRDEDLRAHLLHQIRLRDNMRTDRDAFEKAAAQWPSVEKSVARIVSEMNADKSDGSYYYSWQANIAMAFKDAYDQDPALPEMKDIHYIANKAAKNFLDLLCK